MEIISEPTRLSRKSSTLIVVICLDNKLEIIDSETTEMYDQTDHRLVHCKIKVNVPKHEPKTISYRDFSNFDVHEFNDNMNKINYSILELNTFDTKVNVFNDQITGH
ncbi:hypothetical protein NQ314_007876 [Rhamnusium bicolor]|uniref:Uncharacterized protein n=1 Tax=Rhamnusium bicolor TaxID=1586634 RepID=A0AAV8YFJ5_9CUCU|nr:hypothetical protein NQ314_007876 [Rhamnusium bicolor]